jgi:hypothetical protein
LNAAKLWKAACSINLATLVRAARFGPTDAARKAVRVYDLIDPLGVASSHEPDVDSRVWGLLADFPKTKLSDVVKSGPAVLIEGLYEYVDGSLNLQDQIALMTLVCDRRPRLVFEIGTYNGITTRLIALNSPQAKVHTLDLPQDVSNVQLRQSDLPKDDFHLIAKRRVGEAFLSDPSITNVIQHFGDSRNWDFSPVQGADFLFIDGSHTYPYIRSDTVRCAEAAADRATIVWHDFDHAHYGVVRYLTELMKAGLPVRHVESTYIAMMDYDRSLHLSRIRAAGEEPTSRLQSDVSRPN